MKKLIAVIAVGLSLALAGCGKGEAKPAQSSSAPASSAVVESDSKSDAASPQEIESCKEGIRNLNSNYQVVGAISMPSVDIYCPILDGVDTETLWHGAGTFYPGQQKMGQGNYPLTSHNTMYYGAPKLLTNIWHRANEIKAGDELYTTDLENIYTWQVKSNDIHPETEVSLADINSDQPLLTLITCDDPTYKTQNRQVLRATLKETTPFDQATPEQLKLFPSTYEDVVK